jgi:hypothetical protein
MMILSWARAWCRHNDIEASGCDTIIRNDVEISSAQFHQR